MAKKKLMPKGPGAKVVGRAGLAKPGGTSQPMDGAGERNTGRAKLRPMGPTAKVHSSKSLRKGSRSAAAHKGVRS